MDAELILRESAEGRRETKPDASQSGCDELAAQPGSFQWSEIRKMVYLTYTGWMNDRAQRLGAALAFYTLLSMAPMIIVVIAIAGLAFGAQAAEGRLIWEIQGLVGYQGAVAIQGLLRNARGIGSGTIATMVGFLTLFFGATGVVNELRDALNTIWHVPPRTDDSNWKSLLQLLWSRVFSFAMIVGIGFLLLVSLVVNAWLSAAGRFFGEVLPTPAWILQIVYTALSFIVISALFAVLFKVLPDVVLEWRDVVVGAAATSILFSIGKFLIGLYLGKAGVASTYGAAGSLVIVLVWVYYSSQIFFLGAEFTCVYAHRHGSLLRKRLELTTPKPDAKLIIEGR